MRLAQACSRSRVRRGVVVDDDPVVEHALVGLLAQAGAVEEDAGDGRRGRAATCSASHATDGRTGSASSRATRLTQRARDGRRCHSPRARPSSGPRSRAHAEGARGEQVMRAPHPSSARRAPRRSAAALFMPETATPIRACDRAALHAADKVDDALRGQRDAAVGIRLPELAVDREAAAHAELGALDVAARVAVLGRDPLRRACRGSCRSRRPGRCCGRARRST